jgi:hypothetical protein
MIMTTDLRLVDQLPARNVPVDSLNPSFYLLRSDTSAAHVQVLADAAATAELPPILVQQEGFRIIDGLHRFEVARQREEPYVKARVVDCSDGVALVLAIRSNTMHGLPLTRADRISGAKRILAEHPDWSDRAVAEVAGLSAKSVAHLRDYSESLESELPGKRLGRDGKLHPVNGAEGRKRVVDYISVHPDASIRQIAGEVGVSLGTVHDVRSRLRQGMDPLNYPATREGRWFTAETKQSMNHADGSAARRADVPRPTWPEISGKLSSDPALRYSEGGRAFLRWIGQHAAMTEEWRVVADAVPSHWLAEVGLLADGVIEEWRRFAEWLRLRGQSEC